MPHMQKLEDVDPRTGRQRRRWQARLRDNNGRERAKNFERRVDAQAWLDEQTAALRQGSWVDPKSAKMTVEQWCTTWLAGYATHREGTVRQARTHVRHITREFGAQRLTTIRPSDVRSWIVKLQASGLSTSYVYALHARASQVFGDAVHDGLLARNPCSRRTSPPTAKQRLTMPSVPHVWEVYEAMPANLRPAVLLGAFAGLRAGEVCGLRVSDVDFLGGELTPARQFGGAPLKSASSHAPVPIPRRLVEILAAHIADQGITDELLVNQWSGPVHPRVLERAWCKARDAVIAEQAKLQTPIANRLPARARFHDLRHVYASVLIASGASVKVVQARLRHASATTTLDTYGHMLLDSDEASRRAIDAVMDARPDPGIGEASG